MVKRKAVPISKPVTDKATDEPEHFDGSDDGYVGMSAGMLDSMIDDQASEGSDDGEYDSDEEVEDSYEADDAEEAVEEGDGSDGGGAEDSRAEAEDGGAKDAASEERPTKRSKSSVAVLTNGHSQPMASGSSSNTFNLQLSALLDSTLLSPTPHPGLSALLKELHDILLSLPSIPPNRPIDARKVLHNKIPDISPTEYAYDVKGKGKEVQWKLGWEKPGEVLVGGSWGVCGGYKKGKGVEGDVDLVVVMPKDLFSAKDRTDYRYFHKRVFYLAVIRDRLSSVAKKSGKLQGAKMEWRVDHGDERRPIVAMTVGKGQGLKRQVTINIHAAAPSSLFPASSLSPAKSLLRYPFTSAPGPDVDTPLVPTPLYASSLALDTLHKPHLDHLHNLSRSFGAPEKRTVAAFLSLWRIWARRRGVPRERGGSGWFAQMALGWIVHGGAIGGLGGQRDKVRRKDGLGAGLGHWGAMRAVWQFLAETDFAQAPVFMRSTEAGVPREDFLGAFEHVWTDPTGTVNILAGWEQGELDLLRHHARETLAMLEDEQVDRFDEVFLKDHHLQMGVFDETILVDMSDFSLPPNPASPSESLFSTRTAAHAFGRILRQGLADRVKVMHITPAISGHHLSVGLIYNPAQSTRVLDMGPPSSEKEATEAFRKLWGEKAELRRFKDGSITESVVWPIQRPEDAAAIPGLVVQHLLHHHFGFPASAVHCLSSSPGWRGILQVPDQAREATCTPGAERLGFRPILDGYDELYKLFKSLDDDLPLNILSVSPASELLRYSTPFIPHPVDLARLASAPSALRYMPAADLELQFESSPRWPNDLGAVQKVKLALLEKLARLVVQRLRGAEATIALDPQASDIDDPGALEIVLPKGLAFRVRVHHKREHTLLLRALSDEAPTFGTTLPRPPARLIRPALAKHLERFVYLPAHHQALAPLHHRYPSYSTATRLVKRWFAAHLLSPHVRAEALELLSASVYLDPRGNGVPASGVAGFVRVLEVLSGWAGRKEVCVVPVQAAAAGDGGRIRAAADLRREAEAALVTRSKELGTAVPSPLAGGAWALATEEDPTGLRWTRDTPCTLVAARIRHLATSCLAVLQGAESTGELDVKGLFRTPTEGYDVLLHLSSTAGSRGAESVDPVSTVWEEKAYRNLPQGATQTGVGVSYDPVGSFVADLQRLYGDTLIPFYDAHGGSVVALLWNPAKEGPRGLKPFLGYSSKPGKSQSALVEIDKEGMLAEIARLGKGLVERIERRS